MGAVGPLGVIGAVLLGIDAVQRWSAAGRATTAGVGAAVATARGGAAIGALPPVGRGRLVRAPGIKQRVARIREAVRRGGADARVRGLALGVLTRKCGREWCVPEKDWRKEVTALFDYVRTNVRYTRDPTRHDTYVSATRTLGDWHGGDCDDLAIALGALLEAVGYKTVLRVVQTKDSPNGYNHIYLAALLPEGGGALGGGRPVAMALDASVARPAGWEVPERLVARRMDVEV